MESNTLILLENEVIRPTLIGLAELTSKIENKFEKPVSKIISGHNFWRYENPRMEHIIIQRLYRIISGLKSCCILLHDGHIQELAVIIRTILEFQYDIVFLLENYGVQEPTQHQKKFVEELLKEGYIDINIPFLGAPIREMVSRKKVLASVSRSSNLDGNSSDVQNLVELDTDIYSGYVHGAYPNVMDIYGHDPKNIRYHVFGVKEPHLFSSWSTQILIYVERAILKTFFVAHYFGLEEIKSDAFRLKNAFSIEAEKFGYTLKFNSENPMEDLKKGKPLS